MHLHAFFDHRHFVALFAIEPTHFRGILNRHDAHAVGTCISFDDYKRLVLDAILFVFGANIGEDFRHVARETFFALMLLKIDLAAHLKIGIDQPRIHAHHLREIVRHIVIRCKVVRLAAHRPARMQRRKQRLLYIAQNVRNARRQVVIQQYHAWIKARHAETIAGAF